MGFNCAGEKKLRDQPGGTAMMTIGRLSASVLDTGVDYENLGRWSWILVGGPRKRTRYVVLYQPCSSYNSAGNSVFAQHEDYFERRGVAISPRTILFDQLISQLLLWKANNEEIVLMGDFNEHFTGGGLPSGLLSRT